MLVVSKNNLFSRPLWGWILIVMYEFDNKASQNKIFFYFLFLGLANFKKRALLKGWLCIF